MRVRTRRPISGTPITCWCLLSKRLCAVRESSILRAQHWTVTKVKIEDHVGGLLSGTPIRPDRGPAEIPAPPRRGAACVPWRQPARARPPGARVRGARLDAGPLSPFVQHPGRGNSCLHRGRHGRRADGHRGDALHARPCHPGQHVSGIAGVPGDARGKSTPGSRRGNAGVREARLRQGQMLSLCEHQVLGSCSDAGRDPGICAYLLREPRSVSCIDPDVICRLGECAGRRIRRRIMLCGGGASDGEVEEPGHLAGGSAGVAGGVGALHLAGVEVLDEVEPPLAEE